MGVLISDGMRRGDLRITTYVEVPNFSGESLRLDRRGIAGRPGPVLVTEI
jgi:hypothetical protein